MSTAPRFLANSSSYNIHLPNGALPLQNDEKPPEIINFKLDAQGQIFWNDQPIANKQALESLFMTVAKKSENKLGPDRMTEYKQVAMVMAMTQGLNITKIAIESNASLQSCRKKIRIPSL